MSRITSKLIAAGLSAAVVLLWWPHVLATEGMLYWFARGVAWTLAYELLFTALAPLEDMIWQQTRWGQKTTLKAQAAKARVVGHESTPRRVAALALVALFTVAVPLGLLFQGEPVIAQNATKAQEAPDIIKVYRPTEVKKEQVIKRVEVPAEDRADDTKDTDNNRDADNDRESARATDPETARIKAQLVSLRREQAVTRQRQDAQEAEDRRREAEDKEAEPVPGAEKPSAPTPDPGADTGS